MGGKRRLSAGLLLVLPLWLAARGDVAPRAAALHDDAIVIDTDALTLEEVTERVRSAAGA